MTIATLDHINSTHALKKVLSRIRRAGGSLTTIEYVRLMEAMGFTVEEAVGALDLWIDRGILELTSTYAIRAAA